MSAARAGALFTALLVFAAAALYPLWSRRPAAQAVDAGTPRPTVEVVEAKAAAASPTIRLSGTLKSRAEAALASMTGGPVRAVLISEGQEVRQGQALVVLDETELRSQADSAAAALDGSRAAEKQARQALILKTAEQRRRTADARRGVDLARLQLQKLEAGERASDRVAQAELARARAGLDAARSDLARVRAGARPEERRQAEIQLQGAERTAAAARKNLEELEALLARGGVARVEVDRAREQRDQAEDAVAAARSRLALLDAGPTRAEVDAAEAGVRAAEAAVTAAEASLKQEEVRAADREAARAEVRQAEDALTAAQAAAAEVEAAALELQRARAAVEQARAAHRLARARLDAVTIRSPVDGVVGTVQTAAGEIAAPGRPLVTVVATRGLFVEAAASGRLLDQLRAGQTCRIRLAALPGRVLDGRVLNVGDVAGPDGRSFPVTIALDGAANARLKPGSFARVEVTAGAARAAVSVPLAAVRSEGGATRLWVLRGGRVAEVPVELVADENGGAVIRGDVQPGDTVVVSAGADLTPGDAVQPRSSAP